jgi:Lrp/AsnC family transcriptional regulator, leucine-responsive regulatory protein
MRRAFLVIFATRVPFGGEMSDLDDFDRAILEELQSDGRLSVTALAERIALTPTPCSRRIRRLEEEGYITGYSALLDPKKAGQKIEAFVQVNLTAHSDANIQRFVRVVSQTPAIVGCHAVTGDADYILHVFAEDMEHLSQVVLKTLVRVEGVRDVKSILVLETVKLERRIPIAR